MKLDDLKIGPWNKQGTRRLSSKPLYQTRMAPREILTRPFTVKFQIHFNGIGVSSYLAMVPFEQVAWMGRHMNRFMDLVRGDPESFKHESDSKLGQISQSVFRRYAPPTSPRDNSRQLSLNKTIKQQ